MSTVTPRRRIEAACRALGHDEVIRRCVGLLEGDDLDTDFLVALGGSPAARLLAEGVPELQSYWLHVWALRGLLWASPGDRADVLRRALEDDHWRVREMACKVIARHLVDDLFDAVVGLHADRVARVRAAAERACRRLADPGEVTSMTRTVGSAAR
jgi:hypothetical protein